MAELGRRQEHHRSWILLSISIAAIVGITQSNRTLGLALDVRELAMGEVALHGSSLTSWNCAFNSSYLDEADGSASRSLPLPLGLLRVTGTKIDYRTEPVSVANLLLSPPWHIQFDQSSSWIEDVRIEIEGDHLSMDWNECSRLLEGSSRTTGNGLEVSIPIFSGYPVGGVDLHLNVRPSLDTGITYRMDEEAYAVLVGETDLISGGRYGGDATGSVGGYLTINPGTTYDIGIGDKSSLSFGISPGLHLGIYRREWLWDFELETTEWIESESSSDALSSTLNIITSEHMGFGLGCDIGVAYGSDRYQLGMGAKNLFASIHWPGSRISEYSLIMQEGRGLNFSRSRPDEHCHYRENLNTVLTGNALVQGELWSLAAQIQVWESGRAAGLGYERRKRNTVYRCGLRLDDQNHILPSVGIGVDIGESRGIDLALAGRTMAHGNMGILVGVGIVFP